MWEKRHSGNRIVALGGANYRRNVTILDNNGKEVPGMKDTKALVVPRTSLVSESSFKAKNEEGEESRTLAYYKRFMNQGPSYYGDLDEEEDTSGAAGVGRRMGSSVRDTMQGTRSPSSRERVDSQTAPTRISKPADTNDTGDGDMQTNTNTAGQDEGRDGGGVAGSEKEGACRGVLRTRGPGREDGVVGFGLLHRTLSYPTRLG